MADKYYESLQTELKSLPESDIQERASLTRRIEAVKTATVAGKKYDFGEATHQGMIEVYNDFVVEHKKEIASAKAKGDYSFYPSEKLQMLTDLVEQYDPHGKAQLTYLAEQTDRSGARSKHMPHDIYAALDDMADMKKSREMVIKYRAKKPEKTTEEIKRGYLGRVPVGFERETALTSIEKSDRYDKLRDTMDEYQTKLEAAAENNDIILTVTGAKGRNTTVFREGKPGESKLEIEPVFTATGRTEAGKKLLEELAATEKDLRKLIHPQGADKPDPQLEKYVADEKIYAHQQAAYGRIHALEKKGIITREEGGAMFQKMQDDAKKLHKDIKPAAEFGLNEPETGKKDETLLALANQFHKDGAQPGSTVPNAKAGVKADLTLAV